MLNCKQNIEDTLPELKNLITVGKNYQKALQSNSEVTTEVMLNYISITDASLIASQFYHLIGAIGVRLSSLPGSVRRLGMIYVLYMQFI